jgi:hypothetical protein
VALLLPVVVLLSSQDIERIKAHDLFIAAVLRGENWKDPRPHIHSIGESWKIEYLQSGWIHGVYALIVDEFERAQQ